MRTSKVLCRTTALDVGNAGRQRSGEEKEADAERSGKLSPSMGSFSSTKTLPPPPDLNLCLRIQLLTMKRPDYV